MQIKQLLLRERATTDIGSVILLETKNSNSALATALIGAHFETLYGVGPRNGI